MSLEIRNPLFKNALLKTPQKTPPIWFMRQAGRYHDHYQKLRAKHSFMELCKIPELAAEVALGPIQDFDFDVSILFSDLLFPLEALGMGLKYEPAPELGWNLSEKTIKDIKSVDEAIEDLKFQNLAVKATREVLPKNKSLIGFVGGPWTLFTYACEGGHKGHLQTAKDNLDLYLNFCETLVPLLKKNIQLQLDGGVEVVMLFDTAAGEISPVIYHKFVRPHLDELAKAFPKRLGYYAKGTTLAHMSSHLENSNWCGVGLDHRFQLTDVLRGGHTGFVQGNFDQALLFAREENFESRLMEHLKPFKELSETDRAGWVCGLGHGVLPLTPVKNVRKFIEVVRREFS